MTRVRMTVGMVILILLSSCAIGQPATSLPTPTSTLIVASPTAVVVIPTATNTPVPPTATSTATLAPTATPTQTPNPTATWTPTRLPSPTPTLPPFLLTNDTPGLPKGMGGLIVVNHTGTELNYDLAGKVYKVPANGRMIIFLAPGKYTFSVSATNFAGKSGATEVTDGYYRQQDWG
ncbi:MAG: hypothetical protein HZB51_21330 [Chloroflexi bacterium]|nr:hypothetical protein [Chloroflexota bacterium]